MTSETLTITSPEGQQFTGYLSLPKSGKGPGVVVIQEIFGVNHSIRTVADNLAAEGFVVLAPDLFWRMQPNVELGYEGEDMEKAFEYYKKFNITTGIADLGEAVKALRNHPACTGKVATLGFCLGGKMSYLTAAHHNLDAAVCFYGGGIADHLSEASHIQCAVLMHFGAEDEMIPEDQVEAIRTAFHDRSNVEIYVYPKVGHAFFNADRKSYDPRAAELAKQRSLTFLKKWLG